jgi:hypothetical protein
MLKSTYKGSGNALVIEGDALSVVNEDGRNDLSPIDHPLRVGHESLAISDAEMADILANGTIADPNGGGATWKIVTVTKGEHTVSAYFRELQGAEEGDIPELAAYRLDRLLGLDMIPATVRRVIGDRKGIMQFIPEDAITELHRVASGRGKEMYCSREKQVAVMHVFDALINNQGRTPLSMLYSPDDWLLILIGHDTSFSTEVERPEYLRDIELTVGDQWRAALAKLDDDTLRTALGGVLDDARLAALARRRDALINKE